ncbi:hypothetical protein F5148DRAFT_915639 [Russula earlei]|uniref:Uncharacterized protein n=1 Tax=Russula earlei TaxID=71964 RepID=A0ACC0U9U6_9AGAM|nr:hypothetical protein F5148DRAFT_915639 [Russula earlei]
MANPSSLSDFVRMSAVDDLSYPLACDDRTRDAVNTIVSGRKSWKTLKGKGEAVWPPYLEAALIEALDKYRPETSRSTRSLSRFPNRNRFISDYIYHVTGKRRTAKQVGSRLQQLRDTCGGKRILKLLSNRHFSPPPDADEVSPTLEDAHVSDEASSSPSTSERVITDRAHAPVRTARALVHIDVLAANAPWSPSDDAGIIMGNPLMTPPHSPEAHTFSQNSQVNIFHSPKPRPLRAIDPVVTFASPSFVVAKSSCSVYYDGNCVHTDVADVTCTPTKNESGMFLYRTTLIPQYWDRLCQSHEPGRYSIVQEITQTVQGRSPDGGDIPVETTLLTVVYQLNEQRSSSPVPSSSTASPVSIHNRYSLTSCNQPGYIQDLPISPVSATFSENGDHGGSYLPPDCMGHLQETTYPQLASLPVEDTFGHRWGGYAADPLL